MSTSASAPAPVIILPYVKTYEEFPAPYDDWGFYEGSPTPSKSPLMPYNTVPWFYRKWMFDKIVKPKYSFAQIENRSNVLQNPSRFEIVSKTIFNEPTYITDFHIIAIRKQIEQLFAPLIRAKVIVRIQDELNYPPCYSITHGMFQKSWWIGAEGGNEDGIGSIIAGHNHTFREAGPTGSLRMSSQLTISTQNGNNSDGSIRGIQQDFRDSYGNYYVISITPRWTITEHWRKAFLESWEDIQQDYQSTTVQFQQIMWGPWSDIVKSGIGFHALAYAVDFGGIWEIESNLKPEDPDQPNERELAIINDKLPIGPVYSACSRPSREFGESFMYGSEKVAANVSLSNIGFKKFQSVLGLTCGIYTNPIEEIDPPLAPDFPSLIESNGKVIYNSSTDYKFGDSNCFMDISYELSDMETIEITPREVSLSVAGGTYYAHCTGATCTPYYRIKIMSLNGIEYEYDITEREVYYQ